MSPIAWILAAIAVASAGLAYVADRKNRRLERVNAKLSRDITVLEKLRLRVRDDESRLDVLRQALDSANRKNAHFKEWACEEPVEPIRQGGESS